ncbi:MAG: hypothetical protein S4CHLAM45_07310 [Chlamydiales bacterium]|nr:hypothetical protein [Chlamydiales bacterium]MCH9620252.1 hypothetical protein [Chlamydiales bacterium]MCH9622838.1 hypothetical protein [Chlamydiales bacterium]
MNPAGLCLSSRLQLSEFTEHGLQPCCLLFVRENYCIIGFHKQKEFPGCTIANTLGTIAVIELGSLFEEAYPVKTTKDGKVYCKETVKDMTFYLFQDCLQANEKQTVMYLYQGSFMREKTTTRDAAGYRDVFLDPAANNVVYAKPLKDSLEVDVSKGCDSCVVEGIRLELPDKTGRITATELYKTYAIVGYATDDPRGALAIFEIEEEPATHVRTLAGEEMKGESYPMQIFAEEDRFIVWDGKVLCCYNFNNPENLLKHRKDPFTCKVN